jgi:hypothetical protein
MIYIKPDVDTVSIQVLMDISPQRNNPIYKG